VINCITHYKPHNSKRNGALEHRFIASGAEVKTIAAWLVKDNERHGEWIMDKRALALLDNNLTTQPLRFKFEILESDHGSRSSPAHTRSHNAHEAEQGRRAGCELEQRVALRSQWRLRRMIQQSDQ
jgi:hypothetical protein